MKNMMYELVKELYNNRFIFDLELYDEDGRMILDYNPYTINDLTVLYWKEVMVEIEDGKYTIYSGNPLSWECEKTTAGEVGEIFVKSYKNK